MHELENTIAVVGFSCAFSQSNNFTEYWENLVNKKNLISVGKNTVGSNNTFVEAYGHISQRDDFDSAFFNIPVIESQLTDPQHKLFLIHCFKSLEHAGFVSQKNVRVGVFAAKSNNSYAAYLLENGIDVSKDFSQFLSNAYDCLATRVSYDLDLTGPSFTIQSGCSSSLVALHQARIALLTKQCDFALAGGVSLVYPKTNGYTVIPGGILSPDGKCSPYSDEAKGTVFTEGVGVVLLTTVKHALALKHTIYSIIKASAVNNDGRQKASFSAPSVIGQQICLSRTIGVAKVDASQIEYMEGHGTGTYLGDPIEVDALTQAFSFFTEKKNYCHLGSVKANIGHTDVVSGIASFLKAIGCVFYSKIPGQINFLHANTKINFENSPFTISTETIPWTSQRRIACVNSLGVGGTNASVIIENFLEKDAFQEKRNDGFNLTNWVFVISAKTPDSLNKTCEHLCVFLKENKSTLKISDVAYTLDKGRTRFVCERFYLASNLDDLIKKIECNEHCSNLDISNNNYTDSAFIHLPGVYLDLKSNILYFNTKRQTKTFENSEKTNLIKQTDTKDWIYSCTWDAASNEDQIFTEFSCDLIFFNGGYKLQEQLENLNISKSGVFDTLTTLESECEKISKKQNQFNLIFYIRPDVEDIININLYFDLFLQVIKTIALCNFEQCKIYVIQDLSYCASNCISSFAIQAAYKVIPQEFPQIKISHLELYQDILSQNNSLNLFKQLLTSSITHKHIKYQKSILFAKKFLPIAIKNYTDTIFDHSVGVIFGGLGNIALVYSSFFSKFKNVTLYIVGRKDYEKEISNYEQLSSCDLIAESSESLSEDLLAKYKIIKELRRSSNIKFMRGDITDEQSVNSVISKIQLEHGFVSFVVHAAGTEAKSHFKTIKDISEFDQDNLFSVKLKALYNLRKSAHFHKISKVFVISSISTCLGGIGSLLYAASHEIMDAFCEHENSLQTETQWLVVNWDAWDFFKNEEKLDFEKSQTAFGSQIGSLAISRNEGLQCLSHIYGNTVFPLRVIVSSGNLNARYNAWVLRDHETHALNADFQQIPRPDIQSTYLEPVSKLEKALCQLWADLLGLEKVGIKDNFFELGGHSLLALKCIESMNKILEKPISLIDLFFSSSIHAIIEKFGLKNESKSQENELRLNAFKEKAQKFRQRISVNTKDLRSHI